MTQPTTPTTPTTAPLLEGLWLTEVDGWRVDIEGVGSWTHESPDHPFADIGIELDGLGCLAAATLPLTRPLGIRPFAGTVRLWAHDRHQGWVPLAEGLIKQALDRTAELSELTLEPLETLIMRDYYTGEVPPSIPGVTASAHNLAGLSVGPVEAAWTKTNDQVIGDALRSDSAATIGVDAYRRIILARPGDGSPVTLSLGDLYNVQPSSYEFPPYATATRLDPGVGWRKVERRIDRGPYVPRVAVDSEAVTFREEVRGVGPELIYARTLEFFPGPPGGPPPPLVLTEDVWRGQEMTLEYGADALAFVMVWDLQNWYRQSALYQQDQEALDAARREVEAARLVLAQRIAWYGDAHPFVLEARAGAAEAQRTLDAALSSAVGGESDYEPLTALLTLGLQPLDLPSWADGITMDWAMWVSKVTWDDQAVGISQEPESRYGLLHPAGSPATIKVLLSTSDSYDRADLGRPVQPATLTIPEELFRQNQGPRIAATLLKDWLNSLEPDGPPPGTAPPGWDGRWFLHVGCAYHFVVPAIPDTPI